MPEGKGTYGSQVGRPPKKKGSLLNDDRERYIFGGPVSRLITKLFKKHKSDVAIKSDLSYLKSKIEDIDNELGGIGSENIDLEKEVIGELKGERADYIRGLKQIEEEGVPLNYDEAGFPITKEEAKQLERKIEQKSPEYQEREAKTLAQIEREAEFTREGKQEGGTTEDQMNALAISVAPARVEEQETHTMPDGTEMPGATHEEYEQMLPDEEMEEDYVDYVIDETLSTEDQDYLESALAKDAKLSELFDQVVESASEFSGSGPIEGPGSEISDSIPARLSDGEFVFTAKAVEEIGEDSLMSMMKDAEAAADERQVAYDGGVIDEEDQIAPIQTKGLLAAQGNVPNVVKQSRQIEEEMLKSSPRRYYVPVSG